MSLKSLIAVSIISYRIVICSRRLQFFVLVNDGLHASILEGASFTEMTNMKWFRGHYAIVNMCICFFTGYSTISAKSNYYYTTYNLSAVDFVCSNYLYYLSDCSFTVTSDYPCPRPPVQCLPDVQ